jgi:LuxR family maltose regulon positive regulatory protein
MADDSRHGARGRFRPDPASADPPLVEAKLAVPSVRHGVVDRPRVRRAFDAVGASLLTLVAAPAGYGKTTAVRAWCASRDVALAWVTLDGGDNDPVLLWRYVATAVDRVRPGLGGARCDGWGWRAARSRSRSTSS